MPARACSRQCSWRCGCLRRAAKRWRKSSDSGWSGARPGGPDEAAEFVAGKGAAVDRRRVGDAVAPERTGAGSMSRRLESDESGGGGGGRPFVCRSGQPGDFDEHVPRKSGEPAGGVEGAGGGDQRGGRAHLQRSRGGTGVGVRLDRTDRQDAVGGRDLGARRKGGLRVSSESVGQGGGGPRGG